MDDFVEVHLVIPFMVPRSVIRDLTIVDYLNHKFHHDLAGSNDGSEFLANVQFDRSNVLIRYQDILESSQEELNDN